MDRATAIRKVKACLRLGESANAHEAARAVSQARALMEKFGLSAEDVGDIAFASAGTRARGAQPLLSVMMLAGVIARGYRCTVLTERVYGGFRAQGSSTKVVFVGRVADAEIAAYAFTVLRRQMDAQRLAHISRVRLAKNRAERGEAFAQGWVHSVGALFPAAVLEDGEKRRHDLAIEHRVHSSGTTLNDAPAPRNPVEKLNDRHTADLLKGVLKGRGVRLNQGVGSDVQESQLQLENFA
ncbi:DUF2786 domain-containing protein [Xanthomonas euvesicatoria]|uniref:DUF2786 domain-containing protein n=1 Tax=Xanthomonas euvesicatoria TaxID=456327 RepID=UPI00080E8C26|nr:DUF2786 domain-containing protein [Xanthomonas euvesicatoria]